MAKKPTPNPVTFPHPLATMDAFLAGSEVLGMSIPTEGGLVTILPSVALIGDHDGEAIMRHLEAAIRTAYKSEDKIGPGSHLKILKHILSLKHESTLEHHNFTFRIVTSRGVAFELVRHRLACLAGDSLIKFDLPAGQKGGRRVYSVRLDDLSRRWNEGSATTAYRKKKPATTEGINPFTYYTAKELAVITGRRRETINNLVRSGYLKGEVVHNPISTSPNKRVMRVLGADWLDYAGRKTTVNISQRDRISGMALRMCQEDTGEIKSTTITNVTPSGMKPVYRVSLDNGYTLKMSRDHRVLTSDGWMPLHEAVGLVGERDSATWGGSQIGSRLFAVNGHRVGTTLNVAGNRRGMCLTPEGREAVSAAKLGDRNHRWKGGITPERARIARWTTAQAPGVHERFNYTCQLCGVPGGRLQVHHLDPVYHNIHRAYDPTNLVTVHDKCHKLLEGQNLELELLQAVASGETIPAFWARRSEHKVVPAPVEKKAKTTTRLVRDWARVVCVDYAGDEETFDIEVSGPYHNFVANGFIVHNSYTQESTRYVNYGKRPAQVILPWHLVTKTKAQQRMWVRGQRASLGFYQKAIAQGWTPQEARGFLSNDIKTEIVMTMNIRSLRNFLGLRTASSAHPDMQVIAREVLRILMGIVPLLFQDIAAKNEIPLVA